MMLNIFDNDAFSLTSLTASANRIPVAPGQIGALGIFEESGINTLTVAIEEKQGRLTMVEPSPRGGPGETRGRTGSSLRALSAIHMQVDDAIMADEVQGVREFGTEDQLRTAESVVNERMAATFADFDMTIEHHRAGALKGKILSRDGNTILDLYQFFAIAEPAPISLGLDDSATKLRMKCEDVVTELEDRLPDGVTYSGVHVLCGKDMWKKVANHKSVLEVYLHAAKIAEQLGKTPDTFEIGGITFERYRMSRSQRKANNNSSFIDAVEGRVIMKGVRGMFKTHFAPADYRETVNTRGLPRYAKRVAMPNNKGETLELQTNPLNYCSLPQLLQQLVA